MESTVGIVDIGSYSIKAAIAKISDYEVEIIGFAEEKSKGVNKGNIVKASLARAAVYKAIKQAESQAGGIQPTHYYVLISHPHTKTSNEKVSLEISPTPIEVEAEHLEKLKQAVKEKASEEGFTIIHIIPRYYLLDGEKFYEPLEMIASKIEAEYHVVKIPLLTEKTVEKLLRSVGKKTKRILFPPLMAAEGCLEEEEKELNKLIIDLGHTTTSYVYYTEGSPYLSGVLPVGGAEITLDIATQFQIPLSEAEKLKEEFGYASPTVVENPEEEVLVKNREDKEIPINIGELAAVIEARIGDILATVLEEIYKKGVNIETDIEEIVLVGGGANLKGLKEFLKETIGLPVRKGIPIDVNSLYGEKLLNPAYAALIGAARFLSNIGEPEENQNSPFKLTPPQREEIPTEADAAIGEILQEHKKSKDSFLKRLFINLKNLFSGE
jgi:cell division protein FtsA